MKTRAKAATWTAQGELVIAIARDKELVCQTLRGGRVVDERPAVKGVSRVAVLPSGTQLTLAGNGKGMLVDAKGRGRAAHLRGSVEDLAVCNGFAYAACVSRTLLRLDEQTAKWSEFGFREALTRVLRDPGDLDDVHSVVPGRNGPIVGVYANDYFETLVFELDGTTWRRRGKVKAANAIAWSPEDDVVYGVGSKISALDAKGKTRVLLDCEDHWGAGWVPGGLLVSSLGDVSQLRDGELAVVLPAADCEGEVPHNHSLFTSGANAAFVCGGNVYTFDGSRFTLAFGERKPDLRAERARGLVAKATKKHPVEKLSLTSKNLRIFPIEIIELTDLRRLVLAQNDIPELPESFGALAKLEHLDLSYNHLQRLPDSFGNLTRLRTLNLHLNCVAELPDSFANLTALEELDLGMNTSLQTTELGAKPTTELPSPITRLANLRVLNLSTNELRALPDSFAALTNLEHLQLHQNNFTVFPRVLLSLPKLRFLSIGYQTPTTKGGTARTGSDVPNKAPAGLDHVCKLTNLVELHLDRLDMTSLPAKIGALHKLEKLDLSFNKLKTLPASLYELTNLRELNLECSPLTAATKAALRKRLPKCEVAL